MSYDFYRKIAKILAKDNAEQLFQYIIHAMEDNGDFLRTRWCYSEKTLKNNKHSYSDVKTVLVVLKEPFDFERSTNYYTEWSREMATKLKMEIYCYDMSDEKERRQVIIEKAAKGYSCPIKIDMVHETYERLDSKGNVYVSRQKRGYLKLVETIGEEFYEAFRDSSVFAYGETEKGLYCFLGISLNPDKGEITLSADIDEWDIYASCYVTEDDIIMDKCRLPEGI